MCCVFAVIGLVTSLFFGTAAGHKVDDAISASNAVTVLAVQRTEGCVATPASDCSYDASRPGRYAATGRGWVIEVYRPATGRTLRYSDAASSPSYTDAFGPGDHVTAKAGTGAVWVGARP